MLTETDKEIIEEAEIMKNAIEAFKWLLSCVRFINEDGLDDSIEQQLPFAQKAYDDFINFKK